MIASILLATMTPGTISIPRVDLLPDRPTPYHLRNWVRTTREYDRVVFDEHATAPYTPLVWRVPNVPNLEEPGFGVPSYVGGEKSRGTPGEAIAALGSLLGPTMIGIDKRDWVERTPQFQNARFGVVLNNVGSQGAGSFWYDLLPSILFTQLASKYPDWARGRTISRKIAGGWRTATTALDGNFDHTGYRFETARPADNGQWKEPDAAAGVAYLELFESLRNGNTRALETARKALRSMQRREDNPTYEVLTAYGALAAAYLNAAEGDRWDVPRFVDWCFDPTSPNRVGWGMIVGRWGGYDAGGLMGSTSDGGGYAFAMNTFLNLATLAPIARYDDRYSAPLAKWVLNASNASRLFYKDSLPADHQSGAAWPGDPNAGIAYEGLRRSWEGVGPYAAGDAKRGGWAKEDFGLYGGGFAGLLAALVHPTNVPEILRIDLRATDFLPVRAYATDLLWNPYDTPKTVSLDVGSTPARLYDAVSNRFLAAKPVRGRYSMTLRPKQAVQIVHTPPSGAPTYVRNRTLVDGVPIDMNNGRVPLPARTRRTRTDLSVSVGVPRVERGQADWSRAEPTELVAAKMRADLRFAWDSRYLYIRVVQTAPATETLEAPNRAELSKHRWDFEHVELSFDPSRETFALMRIPELSLGWSSSGRTDLVASDDLLPEEVQTKTGGSASAADRTIEARIPWSALYRAFGTREPLSNIVRPGSKLGCQPLLTDGTFRRQAYLNGLPYSRPNGFDRSSRTLVLR